MFVTLKVGIKVNTVPILFVSAPRALQIPLRSLGGPHMQLGRVHLVVSYGSFGGYNWSLRSVWLLVGSGSSLSVGSPVEHQSRERDFVSVARRTHPHVLGESTRLLACHTFNDIIILAEPHLININNIDCNLC